MKTHPPKCRLSLAAAMWLATAALPAAAQTAHPHHATHGKNGPAQRITDAVPTATATATAAPYAGQQLRTIKALSPQETDDLLQGRGMGLAKAAELNGYPGPMHVLEHSQLLGLSAEQHDATTRLMASHKEAVRALGSELVDAERALDAAFAQRRINADTLTALMKRIGALQAAIRDSHLQTHLHQTALLTSAQITQYNHLRGYGDAAAATPGHRH